MKKYVLVLILLLVPVGITSVAAGDIVAHAHTASSDECTKYCSSAEQPILRIDTIPPYTEGPGWVTSSGFPFPRIDTIYVDTTHYYAEVDTCLTCPEYMDLEIWDTLYPRGVTWWQAERWCVRDSVTGNIGIEAKIIERPDTSITKEWHPKIQVWLMPDEIKWDQCVRKWGGHDTSGFYTTGAGPQKYTCKRCGWSVVK